MKYEIVFGESINNDLNIIGDFIERQTFSKIQSEKIVGELMSSIGVLAIFPYLYQKFYKEFRFINIKTFRVIYFVDEKNKIVIIYRILGQFQNYEYII